MFKYIDKSSHGKQNLFKKNFSDAGYDICSNEDCVIEGGKSKLISTEVYIEIPEGFVAILKSRSGLSVRDKIEVGGGVIDCSYRGEIKVHLYNHSDEIFYISAGDRIAQMIIFPIAVGAFTKVSDLSDSVRGDKGFGSSGV